MELSIYNIKGEVTDKKVTLNDSIFGIEPNKHVIWLDVKQYRANQRQGTHKTKVRNEIRGSGRKLFRQKGTGSARRGDIKSPLLVGGGRAFGPQPRDYGFKLNKKEKALARKSALSLKAQNNAIVVVEDFDLETPRTKSMVEMAKNLKVNNKKMLLVLPSQNKNVYLSARNLSNVNIVTASDINTYKILDCASLILTESSIAAIDNLFNAKGEK
ncbi:MAG: 50S ribosomal protein L4 [Dysgonamonadaceae bacterium]|jgi:large subunit ribosomal protein L4|nr:50S ribosomal protein L4 [Dysgonamonadaceae bacterium]MDD3355313.1 50S ribosomal protein L4 [Dysgonamonadaceae bacterium]MDD3726746.1 50S ribosomal protein L4 [Dysgonamonadaceae bacterium]MDD4245592.1 50S ribosomal protein L4 [Dysgonamonadaceae bacterium]MDD4605042.1 50S ribosomal protein L4 [Dysgonamonadaceae bacterium]